MAAEDLFRYENMVQKILIWCYYQYIKKKLEQRWIIFGTSAGCWADKWYTIYPFSRTLNKSIPEMHVSLLDILMLQQSNSIQMLGYLSYQVSHYGDGDFWRPLCFPGTAHFRP